MTPDQKQEPPSFSPLKPVFITAASPESEIMFVVLAQSPVDNNSVKIYQNLSCFFLAPRLRTPGDELLLN